MKTEGPQSTAEARPSSQGSHESRSDHQNVLGTEPPLIEPAPAPVSSSDNKKVSHEDIELLLQVQNLIERCLQLYMNKAEVVRTLSNRARIGPSFTSLVWQKLEEENSDFFRAYYIRLKLKRQIILFNHLLEHQYQLMYPMRPNVPSLPIQNGIHPMTVNNLPMGYPVHQYPPMSATGHHHIDSAGCGASSGHVVNGVPAPGSFHHVRSTENDGTSEPVPAAPPCSTMSSVSEMAVSPTSVASSNHFPFTPSEISGMGMDTAALDTNFALDAADTQGLHLGPDGGVGSSGSLGPIWNLSVSDLTADFADFANFGDIGDLGDYTGSPFPSSCSDLLLDSPEQDDLVEEYFADMITGAFSQSDEDKS